MLILKSTGTWGPSTDGMTPEEAAKAKALAGADDATFNLEVVGHTPDEVEHLRTLAAEPFNVKAKFEKGALKIELTFERELTLAEQAALKTAKDAQARADAKAAADKAKADAEAKAKADQEAADEAAAEREARIRARAQEIYETSQKKGA